MTTIHYQFPSHWIRYRKADLIDELSSAKGSVYSLKSIPFQRRWVEELQKMQLKMEIAGTSQIEGADFAANELDIAMRAETPAELITRSQKQASAAVATYRWISTLPDDMPITEALMCEVHRRIVSGCDDDHCPPGALRARDQNVTFGIPKHRGVPGGEECAAAFARLAAEVESTYKNHDPLIQALAMHYHFAAMHPFLDGNGRTARALEALMLQRAGLRDSLFIAMSNYYYEEKRSYLESLALVRAEGHDLTAFLKFGLRGMALQTERLAGLIRLEVSKEIFQNLVNELFLRLQSTRKRVIVKRQLILLNKMLKLTGRIEYGELVASVRDDYASRKNPFLAIARDLARLEQLGAIEITREGDSQKTYKWFFQVRLDWPSRITETEFFSRISKLPKSKTYGFLAS